MSFKTYMTFSNEEPKTNALVFATEEEANNYGKDLMSRWMQPTGFEVRESDEEVNYTFSFDEGLKSI